MPELPEVETVRRGLAGVFEGRRLTAVKALRRDLRFPLPTGFSAWLEGRTVATLGRRGKFLLFGFEDGATLIAQSIPLSATSIPYFLSPLRIACTSGEKLLTSTFFFNRMRSPIRGRFGSVS